MKGALPAFYAKNCSEKMAVFIRIGWLLTIQDAIFLRFEGEKSPMHNTEKCRNTGFFQVCA